MSDENEIPVVEFGIFEQYEPLTTRIKNIVKVIVFF
jgi:hypothetical protein